MLWNCEVSFTQNNLELTKYQITAKQLQYFPPPSNPTANACYRWGEDSRATHTIADSRTRHAIIGERWDTNKRRKHRKTRKSILLNWYSETDECEDLYISNMSNPSRNVIWVNLKVDGKPLTVEQAQLCRLSHMNCAWRNLMKYPCKRRKLNCCSKITLRRTVLLLECSRQMMSTKASNHYCWICMSCWWGRISSTKYA